MRDMVQIRLLIVKCAQYRVIIIVCVPEDLLNTGRPKDKNSSSAGYVLSSVRRPGGYVIRRQKMS